eukprot:TRINITY_DN8881_c0_g1_i1.p1 TRINITY_DN8881_c0_g1~~TRINITY_DN8881_c0_g1_i1.p1  ORF type:complete len:437 (-),score=70.88 TRINITY_DN8881_c0_g1_i1:41-1351(-)
MYRQIALLLLLTLAVFAIDNGIGRLPPMGWRSWNCFGGNIDQQKMMSQMDAIADRSRMVNGKPTSLLDVGFEHVGLDDNWQDCGAGINGSFHAPDGHPIINTQRFPDMKKMNDYGHSKNVKPGWYLNNCICSESGKLTPNWPPQMQGDVNAAVEFGYDGVKIDGCGPSHNLLEWAELLNKTGRPMMIENCHDNTTFPYWHDPKTFDYVVCPMNFWRVSNDIQANWGSIISNLQHVIPFQDLKHPIAQPGCWAYPDMLEVANGELTYTESRSHFGAWCVVSAPLILGFDLTNEAKMSSVWDIITNTEAIAVSQTWEGHPGRLVTESPQKTKLQYTLTSRDLARLGKNADPVKNVEVSNWQVWAKTLQKGSQAALILNIAETNSTIALKLSDLGFSNDSKLRVRDIWEHKDITVLSGSSTYTVTLKPHDSSFLRFDLQ